MNADAIADQVVAVDYRISLPEMIAGGKYDWGDPEIPMRASPSLRLSIGVQILHAE